MHGLGNDFIIIDAINQRVDEPDLESLSRQLCDRRFGVGADGVILGLTSKTSDFKMRIFNSDGSEPEMCGNGIRCFSKFLYENHLTEKDVFSVETMAGIIVPALIIRNGTVEGVEVDMGVPVLERNYIPMTGPYGEKVIGEPLKLKGKTFVITSVSMGNPHVVIFVDNLKDMEGDKWGPLLENHEYFPERVNVEFAQILNPKEIVAKVWERGAGETMACGTGACAILVAGVLNQKCERAATIHLPGGALSIEWQEADNHIMMAGPAAFVFRGEVEI